MFKITLVSHGYSFVAKGKVKAFVVDLRHEGHMYNRLESLQGSAVPVCLGNMDLNRTYFLGVGVKIVHMMFMAWGGDNLYKHTPSVPSARLGKEKQRSMDEIRQLGVIHKDERLANMLWNESQDRVMLIDYERAVFSAAKRTREPIEVSQNALSCKKPRLHDREERSGLSPPRPLSLVKA